MNQTIHIYIHIMYNEKTTKQTYQHNPRHNPHDHINRRNQQDDADRRQGNLPDARQAAMGALRPTQEGYLERFFPPVFRWVRGDRIVRMG